MVLKTNYMNRTKAFLYNTVTQAIAQVAAMIAGFVIPRIMLSYYGSDINGLVTSITQFISYFNLVEAGISSAAVYALYKPIAENDTDKISSILSATKRMYIQSGCIFFILVSLLAFVYPMYISTATLSNYELTFLIFILGINGAIEFFAQGQYKVLLTAEQKYFVISFSDIMYYIANSAIVLIVAKLGQGIIALKVIATTALLIRASVLYFYCHRNYKGIDYKAKPNNKALNKRWDALVLQILGVVQSGTPVIILTLIVKDLKIISVYAIYNLVVGGIGSITGIFTTGLFASFGDLIARKEKTFQETYKIFETSYYLMITIAYSCTVILIVPFIRIYTWGINDINYILPITGLLFTLQGFLHNLKTPQGMLVLSAGLFKETRWQTLTQAVLAIICGSVFALYCGINGVLIGLIISEIYRLIDLIFFISKNVTHIRVFETAKKISYNVVVFAVSSYSIFNLMLSPNSYISWLKNAFIVFITITSLTSLITYIFDKKNILSAKQRVEMIIRSKM